MEILFNQNCVQIKTLFNVVLKKKITRSKKCFENIKFYKNNIAIKNRRNLDNALRKTTRTEYIDL